MDDRIRIRVRAAILAGRLPDQIPRNHLGCTAEGETCDVCGDVAIAPQMILRAEIEGTPLHFHPACFNAWTREATEASKPGA